MHKHIIDEMKKEGKAFRNVMILGYVLAVLIPLAIYLTKNEKYTDKDCILLALTFFMLGSIGLYGWLYAIKYKLEITQETIILRTLFRRVNINIKDITDYTCGRYKKSVFYQFGLFVNNKNVLVSTRYKDEFVEILESRKTGDGNMS